MTFLLALAAEAVVLAHFAWIVFVVTGAFFLRRHRRLRVIHLVAVIYSVGIESFGWICPLTHLELRLWALAGNEAYQGAFITHYLERVIYLQAPPWLLVSGAVLVLGVTLYLYYAPVRQSSGSSRTRSCSALAK